MNASEVERAIHALTEKGQRLLGQIVLSRKRALTRSEIAALLGQKKLWDHDRAILFELESAGLIEARREQRRGLIDFEYVYSVPVDVQQAIAQIRAKREKAR